MLSQHPPKPRPRPKAPSRSRSAKKPSPKVIRWVGPDANPSPLPEEPSIARQMLVGAVIILVSVALTAIWVTQRERSAPLPTEAQTVCPRTPSQPSHNMIKDNADETGRLLSAPSGWMIYYRVIGEQGTGKGKVVPVRYPHHYNAYDIPFTLLYTSKETARQAAKLLPTAFKYHDAAIQSWRKVGVLDVGESSIYHEIICGELQLMVDLGYPSVRTTRWGSRAAAEKFERSVGADVIRQLLLAKLI